MANILIVGLSGRMGTLISESATEHGHRVIGGVTDVQNDLLTKTPDIVIDFSTPAATCAVLPLLKEKKIPVIIGTTGLSATELAQLHTLSEDVPVMYATNYSIGVNVLFGLAKLGAKQLHGRSEVEIVEKHHRYKKDSPSGTAVTLGEIVAEAFGTTLEEKQMNGRSGTENTRKDEIAFHALRGGNIIGEHSLQFILENELVEIRHEALNRKIFADGAVSAIPFMLKQNTGFFHIKDAINASLNDEQVEVEK